MKHCPKAREDAAWYSNGTLPAAARRRFEAHLDACPECRAAVALDARLADTLAETATNVLPAPQPAWRRLEARLDAAGEASATDSSAPPPRESEVRRRRRRLVPLAIAAQAAAILLLVGLLWVVVRQPDVQGFRTLGTQDETLRSSQPLLRVVFASGYPDSAAADVAAAAGAELHGRFDGTDIYTLSVPLGAGENRADKVSQVLARLRQHPDVLMAEPMTDAPGSDHRL